MIFGYVTSVTWLPVKRLDERAQLYIQLESALFQDVNDDYICKTATTTDEAKALIEVGFEYVNEINGIQLYRKRK